MPTKATTTINKGKAVAHGKDTVKGKAKILVAGKTHVKFEQAFGSAFA